MQKFARQAALKHSVGSVSRQWRPHTGHRFIVNQLLGFPKSWYSNSLDEQKKRPKTWTDEKHENAKEMLRQGCQVWEVACRLGVSREYFRQRLKDDETLRVLLRTVKEGKFSSEEAAYMGELWKTGVHPPMIAKRLGRKIDSVRQQLPRLVDRIRNNDQQFVIQGPQVLSPEVEEILIQCRLRELWDGLMRLDMTCNWREALSQNPAETWFSIIAKGIPAQVKHLLASHEPPTIAKFEALP